MKSLFLFLFTFFAVQWAFAQDPTPALTHGDILIDYKTAAKLVLNQRENGYDGSLEVMNVKPKDQCVVQTNESPNHPAAYILLRDSAEKPISRMYLDYKYPEHALTLARLLPGITSCFFLTHYERYPESTDKPVDFRTWISVIGFLRHNSFPRIRQEEILFALTPDPNKPDYEKEFTPITLIRFISKTRKDDWKLVPNAQGGQDILQWETSLPKDKHPNTIPDGTPDTIYTRYHFDGKTWSMGTAKTESNVGGQKEKLPPEGYFPPESFFPKAEQVVPQE